MYVQHNHILDPNEIILLNDISLYAILKPLYEHTLP